MNFRQRIFDPNTLWMTSHEQIFELMRKASMDLPNNPMKLPEDPACAPELPEPLYEIKDGVAVIEIEGVIVRTAEEWECETFGLCSLEDVAEAIHNANIDVGVRAILLSIDSPGGEACGTPEIAELVAQSKKPTCAFTSGLMASAAYYIGSQADLVFSSKSAVVGSIGVILTTYDMSGYLAKLGIKANVFTDSALKGAGNPSKPMTEEQAAYLQGMTDEIGAEFRATVKSKRGGVPDSSMQGQCFIGKSSVSAGLSDDISTLEGAMQRLIAISK